MASGPVQNPEVNPNTQSNTFQVGSELGYGGAFGALTPQQATRALQDLIQLASKLPPAAKRAHGPGVDHADRLNAFQLQHRTWTRLGVRHPTVLWPIRSVIAAQVTTPNAGLTTTVAAGSFYPIYYRPENNYANTPNQAAFNDADLLQASQVSIGPGIVYLPTAGDWLLFTGTALTDRTDLLQIDATDPLVAARYLSEQGCHRIPTNLLTVVSTPSQIILPANRNRVGLQITNVDATVTSDLALGFQKDAVAGVGNRLFHTNAAGIGPQTLQMFGPYCFKGDISAIRNGATDANVQVLEWE